MMYQVSYYYLPPYTPACVRTPRTAPRESTLDNGPLPHRGECVSVSAPKGLASENSAVESFPEQTTT